MTHVFSQGIAGCMLVGGTALAGYYAGHRRSDDLDLFTEDEPSQKGTVLAVKSLRTIGGELTDERMTAQFYHATCRLDGHVFTVQVVLDSNLFEVGGAVKADDGVSVADLLTLLKLKAATLVSRASEKDLYDLLWLFHQDPALEVSEVIALGATIDGGVNAESVLMNLVGTTLRIEACDFSTTQRPAEVFADVTGLQKELAGAMEHVLEGLPPLCIEPLIRKLRRAPS